MTKLTVVSAGLGSPSTTRLLADQLAAASSRVLPGHPTATVVEVRGVAREVTDALLTGVIAPKLRSALDAVEGSDALVVVTPTFQGSYAGLFKSFVDLIAADTLRGTPVLLAATGGTERHSLVIEHAMRPLFAYLGALTVPTGVYAATQDFGSDPAALDRRVERAVRELATLTGLAAAEAGSTRQEQAAELANPANPAELAALAKTTEPTEPTELAEARRVLGRATGRPVGDFGDLLRSLGQG